MPPGGADIVDDPRCGVNPRGPVRLARASARPYNRRVDLARTGLPLLPFLSRISALLGRHRALVLTAEPGAGKSTLVPPYLLEAPWLEGRKIIMLEPRRLAAAAVASRIAELLGETVGRRAGYRVRTASRVSGETRIEVVTEALLTRAIQDDPLLGGVGLVIFDEFHERSIHADLALALAREVRRARPELALLVMSATLDAEGIAGSIGGEAGPAPVLHCPGRTFPVETVYRPLGAAGRWQEGFADGVRRLFDETDGDILAFLPGAGEIRRAAGRLAESLGNRARVLPLHGSLTLEAQQEVVKGGTGGRRIILATSIAETSLTVPGIRSVADAGWARVSRFHHSTGLDRLVTERVSAASAEQRRGRAGRLGPGLCVRFWSESERLPPHPEPEILRSDLSGLALECALWGAGEPGALRWIDAPPAPSWMQAREVLRMLGLVDDHGPTGLGRRVAGLGLPPRLGVLAHEGAARGEAPLAAACAAVLAERDGSGLSGDPDIRLRLQMLRMSAGGSEAWRKAAVRETERILRRLGARHAAPGWTAAQEGRIGGLLARAFPDRIARREPDGAYRFVTGRIARFPASGPGSGASVPAPSRAAEEWIAAPDADAGEVSGTIRLAAPVARAVAEEALAPSIEETTEVRWAGMAPKGVRVRRAGRLVLSERPVRPPADEAARSFLERLSRQGVGILPWDERARALLARMRFYASRLPSRGLGDLSDEGLSRRAAEWLVPCMRFAGPALDPEHLRGALRGMLGSARSDFEASAPESIVLPTGSRRAIEYAGGTPAVEARIQEVFGLGDSPFICGVPLAFRLLSPARRPLQVTSDLAGFWRGSYAEVRKEMRGRYPKHYWPENPLEAEPTSGVRPRRRS